MGGVATVQGGEGAGVLREEAVLRGRATRGGETVTMFLFRSQKKQVTDGGETFRSRRVLWRTQVRSSFPDSAHLFFFCGILGC